MKLEHDGRERVMRVAWLEPSNGRIRMAEHQQAGELDKRHAKPNTLDELIEKHGDAAVAAMANPFDEADPFRWLIIAYDVLRRRKARRVTVDPLGRMRDPGFPKWADTPTGGHPASVDEDADP